MSLNLSLLQSIIKIYGEVSSANLKKITDLASLVQLEKGTLICKEGSSNNKEYFLTAGICRSFILSEKGEEISLGFYIGPVVLPPQTSRVKFEKSLYQMECLSGVEILELPADQFLNLMVEEEEIRNWGNAVLHQELSEKVEKELILASCGGKEKLQWFRSKYPLLEQQIPHGMIASFLGMTNISLSRLRGGV
ncbi:Crp/Fnr family transcriptional regulator [Persicobacter diffluens]|uniref:DNA-binding protein n=1 Tax=Persicobacter diffluens TaxID=981 RepID=A0AAN5AJG0_9BACT|nr:DNA-binding protein [Persicobacter diffluens]